MGHTGPSLTILLCFGQLILLGDAALRIHSNYRGTVPLGRPRRTEYAKMARWLVHVSDWATVSTQSTAFVGFPYGNVVAISDGGPERSTGRIFFYLTDFDQTAVDLTANPKATVNICQAQIPGECDMLDAEDPRCAKLTIVGEITKVPDSELDTAKELMFRRHRQMKNWHAHKFIFYEMHIGNIKLLDYYGGYNEITADDYFAAWLVMEEMKSDPCWVFPHRFYCVEDRHEAKKQMAQKMLRSLARKPPQP